MSNPQISIVIPSYNRAAILPRAIQSCLAQEGCEFEVIVVDDGSTDGSVEEVRGLDDQRLKLVRHELNRGVGAARNTGVAKALSEWIVLLDSDDELLPGSLKRISQLAADQPEEVGRIVLMYEMDKGGSSPEPPLTDEVWDYAGYIRWASRVSAQSDALQVLRRSALLDRPFPEIQGLESLFHLDFALKHRTRSVPEVVARIHSDASNRITRESTWERIQRAKLRAEAQRQMLKSHGEALLRHGPSRYWNSAGALATNSFLAGEKRAGARWALHYLARFPWNARMWVILFTGLLGVKQLGWVLHRKAGQVSD